MSRISFPRISKENRVGVFLTKLELSLRYFTNFWSTAPRPARPGALMAGVFIARTPTFFFLLSPWIESFVAPLQIAILWLPWVPSRAQLANELLSNLHHAARAQHECSTAVDLSYSVRCWIDGLQHYVWRSKVRPHDQDSALLQNSSRENARRAALSVLCAKSEHACESLRFAWSSGDLRWGIDERKQRWRRRRSRKGKNSWWGHFCEIMRQRNEKGRQSTTRKDLRRAKTKRHNVPDSRRALHMHVLERDFGIRAACMQHDCATCASMLRDAVTAAQSRFLATSYFCSKSHLDLGANMKVLSPKCLPSFNHSASGVDVLHFSNNNPVKR